MGTLEDHRRDVISYANRVVEERLADDPNRLTAFRTLAQHFDNYPNCHHTHRIQMIRDMFGEHNQDLTQIYFPVVQELYEQVLLQASPQVQKARLIKLAKMCYHVQFMDLYRLRFCIHSSDYSRLHNAVQQFVVNEITEPQMFDYLDQVLRQFPDFRIELAARVDRLTSLFRGGAGNPPPQV
ncbi:hypothetical protein ACET3Z_022216 [Daucus carota]